MPPHFLVEVAGAVSRLMLSAHDGIRAAEDIRRDPTFTFHSIDFQLARASAEVAATHRIRGADAIYVALAQRLNLPLVTWDTEQLQRAGQIIEVLTPAQALERMA